MKANLEDLRKYSILICTPLYGGNADVSYMKSLLNLQREALTVWGIDINYYFISGESLIPRARNQCANFFVTKTKYTHMLFIDGDIQFDTKAVIDLLVVFHNDPEKYQLLAVPYAKKTISWEKIHAAANAGVPPMELHKLVGDLVINPIDGQYDLNLKEPCKVMEAGTGFMMITRELLDKFEKTYYNRRYKSDITRREGFGAEEVMYFNCEIDEVSHRYLSEDYLFCKHIREMGNDIWILPWPVLGHVGKMKYEGDIAALANMGLSLTIDNQATTLYEDQK